MAIPAKEHVFTNSRGQAVQPTRFKATAAKNSFGQMLDTAARRGICTITKRDRVEAVLLSIEEYEALMARVVDPMAELASELDGLLEEMQAPKAKRAARGLFASAPSELGRAAVKAARRG